MTPAQLQFVLKRYRERDRALVEAELKAWPVPLTADEVAEALVFKNRPVETHLIRARAVLEELAAEGRVERRPRGLWELRS
jgi:hypothetical protein